MSSKYKPEYDKHGRRVPNLLEDRAMEVLDQVRMGQTYWFDVVMRYEQEIAQKQECASELYEMLEYYRNFMPSCVNLSESDYALTHEAIRVDAILASWRELTGAEAANKPS